MKQIQTTTEAVVSKKTYESPRLEIVELQPEEQLLACDKLAGGGTGNCGGGHSAS